MKMEYSIRYTKIVTCNAIKLLNDRHFSSKKIHFYRKTFYLCLSIEIINNCFYYLTN